MEVSREELANSFRELSDEELLARVKAGTLTDLALEVAASEERAVITNNVKDFRPLAGERLAQGRTHAGLILLPSKRTRTRAPVATLAGAIEKVLHDHPDGLAGGELWIGPL